MPESDPSIREFRAKLRALEREVELSMSSDAGCCGVTFAQCHLLLEIERRGQSNVTELASALELDKSTLSRTVDGAWKAGLLDRQVDPNSRRQQVISLTRKGRETANTINGMCDASYTRLLDFIPAAKRRTVIESVVLLADAMRQKRKNPHAPCCADEQED